MSQENSAISVRVQRGDVLDAQGDVLALKHARGLYGADEAVVARLEDNGIDVLPRMPGPEEVYLLDTANVLNIRSVLFVGVNDLWSFGYEGIRTFARRVLSSLAGAAPETRSVLVTLHGANYGLDEIEAFRSEIAGFVDAVSSREFPPGLREVTFVERNRGRAARLTDALAALLPDGVIPVPDSPRFGRFTEDAVNPLRGVGYNSASKPHVFVAMPFSEEMDDVFHYGIQNAVNRAGFLCERADLSTFSGDVMGWIKQRIGSAALVIADLSGANPNVYLEVGYAWGCDRPTLLLTNDVDGLKFDVRGQRCLIYRRIRDLEESLTRELDRVKATIAV